MPFKVKLFSGTPDYEALHVAKLTDFPLEKRDYKPYSQARVCFAQDGFHLQLLSFEAEPLPDSKMSVYFCFFNAKPALHVSLSAAGEFDASVGNLLLSGEQATVHTFTGEDLQGVYWGGNICISYEVFQRHFPEFVVKKGSVFFGNLYKLCENPQKTHFGSYYPANFQQKLDAPENLGEFVIIDF